MIEPKTVDEVLEQFAGRPVADLEAEYQRVVSEGQAIAAQLSNKNMVRPDGQRVTPHQYHSWRGKALGAQRFLLAYQRALKGALKEANRQANVQQHAALGLDTPEGLIDAAYLLLHRLSSDGVDLDVDEQRVVDALRANREARAFAAPIKAAGA